MVGRARTRGLRALAEKKSFSRPVRVRRRRPARRYLAFATAATRMRTADRATYSARALTMRATNAGEKLHRRPPRGMCAANCCCVAGSRSVLREGTPQRCWAATRTNMRPPLRHATICNCIPTPPHGHQSDSITATPLHARVSIASSPTPSTKLESKAIAACWGRSSHANSISWRCCPSFVA